MSINGGFSVIVISMLLGVCAAMTFAIFQIPASVSGFAGACFLGLGVLNMLLFRVNARIHYRWGRGLPVFGKHWDVVGENGLGSLYMGLGIILAAGGCLLIIKGKIS